MPTEIISKKLATMQRVTDHLQGMTPDWKVIIEGVEYACPYDLSSSIYRGRLTFGDEIKPPFVAILEQPRQLNPAGGGLARLVQDEDWTLLIQGFAKDNPKHPTDPAYDLLAWVQMRMSMVTEENTNGVTGGKYPNIFRLGDLVGEVRYQIPIVRPGQDDVSGTAYFYMPITVGTVTDLTNPFIVQEV